MVDRNQLAQQQFAAKQREYQARMEFQQLIAQGRAGLVDDIGTKLEAGQLVVYAVPPNTWRWLVKSIEPDVRPEVPIGTMKLVLVCEVPLYFGTGTRLPQLLVVGDQRAMTEDAGAKQEQPSDGDNDGTPDVPRAKTDPTA